MKIVRTGISVALLVFLGSSAFADAPGSVQISAQMKHELGKVANSGKNTSLKTDKLCYVVKLTNATFHDLPVPSVNSSPGSPGLDVEYRFFVERQRLGEKRADPPQVERIDGVATLDMLKEQTSATVTTNEISLNTSNVVGDLIYPNGGRIRAEDSVVGFWVRVMLHGEMLGEYTSPASVAQRGWDKK